MKEEEEKMSPTNKQGKLELLSQYGPWKAEMSNIFILSHIASLFSRKLPIKQYIITMQNDSPSTHLCGFLIVALFSKLHERKQYINLGTPTFIVNIIKYTRGSDSQYVFIIP